MRTVIWLRSTDADSVCLFGYGLVTVKQCVLGCFCKRGKMFDLNQ